MLRGTGKTEVYDTIEALILYDCTYSDGNKVNNEEGVAIGNVVDNTVASEISVSKSMNDFVVDDVNLDNGNHENVIDSGDVNKSVNNLNNDGNNEKYNGNGVDTNRATYANQLIKDVIEVDNKFSFVPTTISENGIEVVIFDEELLHERSRKWKLTASDYFVGCKMSEDEESMNHLIENRPWMVHHKPMVVQKCVKDDMEELVILEYLWRLMLVEDYMIILNLFTKIRRVRLRSEKEILEAEEIKRKENEIKKSKEDNAEFILIGRRKTNNNESTTGGNVKVNLVLSKRSEKEKQGGSVQKGNVDNMSCKTNKFAVQDSIEEVTVNDPNQNIMESINNLV
ncbi:hypothetical protein Tco_1318072 [Tanacetum coccineum]